MSSTLPEGIYYRKKPEIGNSFCLISLRAINSNIEEVGYAISEIWDRLSKLKKGVTTEFETDVKHRKIGNLTVLLGYGAKIFDLVGSKKVKPTNFADAWNFIPPRLDGGGQVLEGSGMTYSRTVIDNHLLLDHIIFQFIADNEFYTNRAALEVWRELRRLEKNIGHKPFWITGFYTGFQRADKRNWLGFHDGVSNLKSRERPYVISINSKYLSPQDKWTANGSYLAFMRIVIDLERWDDINRSQQEIMIGRDKVAGCPIIIDHDGRPVKIRGCPVPGTSEVIDGGNERFRDPPSYRNKILQHSHIGSTRSVDQTPIWHRKSFRIYRQGFEFLTALNDRPVLIPGLNFVSFQNTPERLFRALTYGDTLFKKNTGQITGLGLNGFLSVLVAGIFLVPPLVNGEAFPGSQIFGIKELRLFRNR
jgi:Dyp-type peroxidase family